MPQTYIRTRPTIGNGVPASCRAIGGPVRRDVRTPASCQPWSPCAPMCWDRGMARFVAVLRAVTVGGRTVAMTAARDVLTELGFDDVASFANTGNLIFSA